MPYALAVHPKTQEVWITSNMSDRMFRFDPKAQRFVCYAMPSRVTWLRDLVFTKDGGICLSSSNLPAYAGVGFKPIALMLGETVFLAALVLALLHWAPGWLE